MKTLLTLLILLSVTIKLKAQNIECVGNTVNIPLSGYKTGVIQWQFSADKQNWADLAGQTTTNLQATATETGYFRAKVVNGSCEHFSDTTYIEVYPYPTQAYAGNDIIVTNSDTVVTLSAKVPLIGKGKWSIILGDSGKIFNDTIAETSFKVLNSNYILRWTTSTKCDSSIDDIVICLNSYSKDSGKFIDTRDNKQYKWVKIGSQYWMAENLNYEYIIHNPGSTFDASFAYNNAESNADIYGRLYSYDIANHVCPLGWHLPSDDEWKELEVFLGMSMDQLNSEGWRGSNQGYLLKSRFIWQGTGYGLDSVGFNALPGGYSLPGIGGAYFQRLQIGAFFWTSTYYQDKWDQGNWARQLEYNDDRINRIKGSVNRFSVRCVKD